MKYKKGDVVYDFKADRISVFEFYNKNKNEATVLWYEDEFISRCTAVNTFNLILISHGDFK